MTPEKEKKKSLIKNVIQSERNKVVTDQFVNDAKLIAPLKALVNELNHVKTQILQTHTAIKRYDQVAAKIEKRTWKEKLLGYLNGKNTVAVLEYANAKAELKLHHDALKGMKSTHDELLSKIAHYEFKK